jgi:FKBP-type peptidyl-prolyl cis-trans isomerase 2
LALYIAEVDEQSVKADGNHPLVGQDLTLCLTLREIRQAA